ncbi:MAG TPA: UDP-N-acetylmuramoyl-tripeptide--D-alanyl-D-alanine ligase [Desulfobacterales bacterium]|nr:UDP-N-acetylmuramoyl-tripeptide--D-alanyl-D-alanine ligase [Desulfobacterales bacterium]
MHDILKATGAERVCGDGRQRFAGISIDSRTIAEGELFVAIRGGVHDGHRFIPDVLGRGVTGLLIDGRSLDALPEASRAAGRVACAAVADTTRALGDLGAFHRRRSRAAVIAVTGSNGKTSTRRMTAAVASQRYRVLEADRNLNNQIGVPLTLFRLAPEHEWAVLELGTSMPGEIARLADICAPEIGVITNIGPAHLEGLGSLEGVLAEKSALLFGLRADGRAVLNADDPRLRPLAQGADPQALLFGLSADAGVRAARIQETAAGLDFDLMLPSETVRVHLGAHGRFMVQNALAAAAVGHLLGLSGAEIAAGLGCFTPVAGRMQVSHLPDGITLIDDTYNANPASMEAALAVLDSLKGGGRSILVTGDMRELGNEARHMHREIGRLAAQTGVGRLLACGDLAAETAAGARSGGMAGADIVIGTRSDIAHALLEALRPADRVLVKGSRAMGMEHIIRAIQDWSNTRQRQKV